MQVCLGDVWLSTIKKTVFIIFVNFIVNSEKLNKQIPNYLWEASLVQVA